MTKKVKAMHAPAGAPGNLQDVADLQQMLAQSQAEIAGLEKRNEYLEKTVKTLAEQRDGDLADKEMLRAQIEEKEGENAEQADRIDELESSNENLREAIAVQNEEVQSLIDIRNRVGRGGIRDELDRLLNFINPSWRCGGCNVGTEALKF